VQVAITWTHLRYGVWLPDAAPVAAIARSRVPVLLMTGTADSNIPMHHAEELERTCGPGRCALWVVTGAGHGGISTVTGAQFGQRILAWFEAHDSLGRQPRPVGAVALHSAM
jgi:pimeloyl-ACP methyl ester carboxylesterase